MIYKEVIASLILIENYIMHIMYFDKSELAPCSLPSSFFTISTTTIPSQFHMFSPSCPVSPLRMLGIAGRYTSTTALLRVEDAFSL